MRDFPLQATVSVFQLKEKTRAVSPNPHRQSSKEGEEMKQTQADIMNAHKLL